MVGKPPSGSFAYDPILGYIELSGRLWPTPGGYKTWQRGFSTTAGAFRILAIGNETTAWSDHAWSRDLARSLPKSARSRSVRVYNGAGHRSGSPQELLRLLRDAPAMRPSLVVSLSGAVDAALGWKVRSYPFRLGKPTIVEDLLERLKLARNFNFGFPETQDAAMTWCRNQRLSARIARELGSHILTFLQPVKTLGALVPPGTRDDFLRELGLEGEEQSRAVEEIESFYAEVRALIAADPEDYRHVVDLSHLLAERQDTFTHAWTLNADGAALLSRAIVNTVCDRWAELSVPADVSSNDEPKSRGADPASRVHSMTRIYFCRTSGFAKKSGLAAGLERDARLAMVLPDGPGPSNFVSMPWDVRNVDFRHHDLCVIECAVTEEVLVHQGRVSAESVLEPIIEVVHRAAGFGCRVLVVVEASQRRFGLDRPLADRLVLELRSLGVAVFDIRSLLDRVAKSFDLDPRCLFDGPLRLKASVEGYVARFLADQLVSIAAAPRPDPRVGFAATARPSRFAGISEFEATMVVGGKPADERFQEMPAIELGDGAAISLKTADIDCLEGVVFAPHHSAGRLVDLDGNEVWRFDGRQIPAEKRRYFLQTAAVPSARRSARTLTLDASGSEAGRLMIAGFIVRSLGDTFNPLVAPVDDDHLATENKADDDTLRIIASARMSETAEDAGSREVQASLANAGALFRDTSVSFRERQPGLVRRQEAGSSLWATAGGYIGKKLFSSKQRRKADGGDVDVSDGAIPIVSVFDPMLGQINARAAYPHFKGGYKIWPGVPEAARAQFRIMTIGNSSSLWPSYPWSLFLGEALADAGYSVSIYNGAGKGHSSSQEIIRIVRDAPALKPHLIVALSGICDIGYLVNTKGSPFLHKYSRELTELVKTCGFAKATRVGYPDPAGPADVWCRNQRFARVLSAELGINYLTLLQPVMGYGKYQRSPEEDIMFREKAAVVLKGYDRPYGEAVTSFYDDVFERIAAHPEKFSHVVSLVDVFDGCSDVYKDHRHLTENGCRIIASAIEKIVLERFGRQLARARTETSASPESTA